MREQQLDTVRSLTGGHMPYEMKNGLLVPASETPPITVFIDETYLLDRSGFLQAAVPIPLDRFPIERSGCFPDPRAKEGTEDGCVFDGPA
jgi:hypothetical protein